jgi:hypothetical protein
MSDYLWNKSGEPDAEVERLEELLGTFRHQPSRLELPSTAKVERPRALFFPAIAVAAAIALMLLGAAWLMVVRTGRNDQPVVLVPQPSPVTTVDASATPTPEEKAPALKNEPKEDVVKNNRGPKRRVRSSAGRQSLVATKTPQQEIRDDEPKGLLAEISERQQAAKVQLIYALRLTGAKLNDVQARVRAEEQDPSPR